MKTFSAKAHEVQHDWLLVDATDKILGRLASQIGGASGPDVAGKLSHYRRETSGPWNQN